MIKNFSQKYTVSNRWILRNDPNYHTPYTLFNVNAARKSKVDDNTAKMQSIKQLGV